MINVILQFLELDLVNINVSAKFYQNIPNGLRVKFHCFQNLNSDVKNRFSRVVSAKFGIIFRSKKHSIPLRNAHLKLTATDPNTI